MQNLSQVYSKEEKKQLVLDFWLQFDAYCNTLPVLQRRKRKWMLRHTKVKDVHLKFEPGRNYVAVALELVHRNADSRIEMFERIEQYKVILEERFPNGLIWDPFFETIEANLVCRIYTQLNGVDLHRMNDWPQMFEFMARNMLQLERNFKHIKDFIAD